LRHNGIPYKGIERRQDGHAVGIKRSGARLEHLLQLGPQRLVNLLLGDVRSNLGDWLSSANVYLLNGNRYARSSSVSGALRRIASLENAAMLPGDSRQTALVRTLSRVTTSIRLAAVHRIAGGFELRAAHID
jgi:hypothetical protein